MSSKPRLTSQIKKRPPPPKKIIREPDGGYWWVRRSDGRLYIVEVIDHAGKKTVMMIGNPTPSWLNQFRSNFAFLERIPDHPSGVHPHSPGIVQGQMEERK